MSSLPQDHQASPGRAATLLMARPDSNLAVEGTVEQINQTGLRVAGVWYTVSRFHPVALPSVGTRVQIQVDGKGFIRELETLEAEDESADSASSAVATRLAVLDISARFAASRPDVKSSEVLAVADKWLAWVKNSPGPRS